MNVVLFTINGSWAHTSLALRCLRGPLERAGFNVILQENTVKDRTLQVLETLLKHNGDVYGFSCYIWNLPEMLSLAETLKFLRPSAKIILGGPEVSYVTDRFRLPFIDGIVTGEGEEAFSALCEKIRDGKPFEFVTKGALPPVMRDEGILYREDEKRGTILYYESSRGCPFSCAYCLSSATHGVRMKSAEQTLTDLRAFETPDCTCKVIKFVDRTFNADSARANRIWEALLDDSYTKRYQFEVCADLLNEESFSILSRFPKGKIQLEFGLQSTNPETLSACCRPTDPQKVLAAVRRIHANGKIHTHLDLIAGLPFETYDRFGQSFDEAYGSCDLLQVGFLKLLYGTSLRERAEEYGMVSLAEPPYTVLQTRWISFAEMRKLMHIAEALERTEEGDNFAHTLFLLRPLLLSPFRFYERLSARIEETGKTLQKISQPDFYRLLLREALASVPDVDERQLRLCLCTDFEKNERKKPPTELRPC